MQTTSLLPETTCFDPITTEEPEKLTCLPVNWALAPPLTMLTNSPTASGKSLWSCAIFMPVSRLTTHSAVAMEKLSTRVPSTSPDRLMVAETPDDGPLADLSDGDPPGFSAAVGRSQAGAPPLPERRLAAGFGRTATSGGRDETRA